MLSFNTLIGSPFLSAIFLQFLKNKSLSLAFIVRMLLTTGAALLGSCLSESRTNVISDPPLRLGWIATLCHVREKKVLQLLITRG